jgi:ATP synthase protein I
MLYGYKNKYLQVAGKVVKTELILGLLTSLIIYLVSHKLANLVSALLGTIIAVVPTLVYAKITFAKDAMHPPQIIFKLHKRAMVARFILTLLLFAIVFKVYKGCNGLVLLLTYFIALSGYWFSLLKINF